MRLPSSCEVIPLDGPWSRWRGAPFRLHREDVYPPGYTPPRGFLVERRGQSRDTLRSEIDVPRGGDVRWRCQFIGRSAERREGFQIDTWCGPDSDVVRGHREDAPHLWKSTDGAQYRAITHDSAPEHAMIQVLTGRCFTSVDLIYSDEAERDAEAVARLIADLLGGV